MRQLLLVVAALALGVGAWFLFFANTGVQGTPDPGRTPELNEKVDESAPGETVDAEAGPERLRGSGDSSASRDEAGIRDRDGNRSRPLPKGGAAVQARFLVGRQPVRGAHVELSGRTAANAPFAKIAGKTDRDGRIRVEELPAGKYRFGVSGDAVPIGSRTAQFELGPDEDRDLGDQVFAAPASIVGALATTGGAPIADAHIALGTESGFADFLSPAHTRSLDGLRRIVRSDAQGRFRFPAVRAGEWVLRIDHPVYRRLEHRVELEAGEREELGSLTLETGLQVSGVVVDQNGKAVEGAEVAPRLTRRVDGGTSTGYSEYRTTKTDAQGRFTLGGLEKPLFLRILKKGYDSLVDHPAPSDGSPVQITLYRGCALSGRIAAAGVDEMKGGIVHALLTKPVRHDGMRIVGLERPVHTDCDSEGRFSFDNLKPGAYELQAELPGFGVSRVQKLDLPARGRNDVLLRVQKGPSLEVLVLDGGGNPAQGASVELAFVKASSGGAGPQVRISGRSNSIRRLGKTNEEGKLLLAGLWRGKAELRVRCEGFLDVETELTLGANDAMHRVQLESGGTIAGIVYSPDGKPVAGQKVVVEAVKTEQPGDPHREVRRVIGGNHERSIVTDSEGRFRSEPLRPGPYRVGLPKKRAPQRFGSSGTFVSFGGPEELDESSASETTVVAGRESQVTIRAQRKGRIRGTVSHRGQPVLGARVFAHLEDGDAFAAQSTKSDGTGAFVFEDLSPGTYVVSAKPEGGRVSTPKEKVELRPGGGEARADLRVGGGRIYGYVAPPSGRSPRGLEVSLQKVGDRVQTRKIAIAIANGEGGAPKMSTMTQRPPSAPEPIELADDGRFDFRYVPEGDWVLVVEQADGSRLARRDLELGANSDTNLGRIELEATWPIVLEVVDPDGTPVRSGHLTVRKWSPEGQPQGATVFRGGIRGGKAEIGAIPKGRFVVEFSPASRSGDREPQFGEFRVGEGGRLEGSLRLQRK